MYFYEILQSIMLKKNLNIPEVSRLSGLPDSTIRSIFARKNKTVALEVAFKLAKGLQVSLEELNGEAPLSPTSPAPPLLSDIKNELLEKVYQLPEDEVAALLAFIDSYEHIKKVHEKQ